MFSKMFSKNVFRGVKHFNVNCFHATSAMLKLVIMVKLGRSRGDLSSRPSFSGPHDITYAFLFISFSLVPGKAWSMTPHGHCMHPFGN